MMEELLQQANHRATVSVTEIEPVNVRREQDMSEDEIISIEDTYRESNF